MKSFCKRPNNEKLFLLMSIVWALLILFFIFAFGVLDVPFYAEYAKPITAMVAYGRGFEYEEVEGRITAVGWSIICISFFLAIRIVSAIERIYKPTQAANNRRQNDELFINLCTFGTATFGCIEAILFKVLFFRVYESHGLSLLSVIGVIIDITLAFVIYRSCRNFYKKRIKET